MPSLSASVGVLLLQSVGIVLRWHEYEKHAWLARVVILDCFSVVSVVTTIWQGYDVGDLPGSPPELMERILNDPEAR